MWRVLRSGGVLALSSLAVVGAACADDPRPPRPIAAAGGTLSIGGALTIGGAPVAAGTGGAPLSPLSACGGPIPLAPLTRWSIVDIDNTLDDSFGPGSSLAPVGQLYESGYRRELSSAFVRALRTIARERVQSVVADSDSFDLCEDGEERESCVATWLADWGHRLYRRPLTSEQTDAYVAQYRGALRAHTPPEAARNALVSMILSPYFVLRIELGEAGSDKLTAHEVAARLSHYAARRSPDAALRASAVSGELGDPAVLVTHLHRLWSSAEGQRARALQHMAWFGLEASRLPQTLDAELREDMLAQTEAFVQDVFANQGGTLRSLLTSARQPLTRRLAAHYGVAEPSEEGLLLVELDPLLFAGMQTQGTFLTTYPRPTLRGRELVEKLLCARVPDHPPDLDYDWGLGGTPRERIQSSVDANPACKACHNLVDPPGFALEAFDDQGRLTGLDTSGGLVLQPGGSPAPVTGPVDLANQIADAPSAPYCAARHYLGYALDTDLFGDGSSSGNLPSGSGPPPVPIIQEKDPITRWVDCLVQLNGSADFELDTAAEQLVTSTVFSTRMPMGRRVVAFDNAIDPLEHALQETTQLRGVILGEYTLERYHEALRELQMQDARPTPGAGGAGGAGGAAGEASAAGAGSTGAGGAP